MPLLVSVTVHLIDGYRADIPALDSVDGNGGVGKYQDRETRTAVDGSVQSAIQLLGKTIGGDKEQGFGVFC